MAITAWKVLKTSAIGVGFTVVVVFLLMSLAGVFDEKIGSRHSEAQAAGRPVGGAELVDARVISIPATEAAVGTIRAVHESSVASKLLAKVVEVNVQAGQPVTEGDVLVRLDDEDLRARLEQSQAAVDAAVAARDQAQVEYDRVKRLVDRDAAAPIEFERRRTALREAEARLDRLQQALREAETILSYATITSPISGVIVDKQVEAGDMVSPGKVLLTLYDPTRMQLVASVRESLTQRLKVGEMIGVRVDALDKACAGRISEIVPEAEAASRSFQVKVTGPCPPGIYSGMFGRLLIPLDDEEVLVIPRNAVRRVGQLHIVDVADGDRLYRRVVQPGREFGGDIEILSGLRLGERVAVDKGAGASSEGA